MSSSRPFLFDRRLDDPHTLVATGRGPNDRAGKSPPRPLPKTFDENDIARARTEGAAEGRAAGLREAEAGSLARLEAAVGTLGAKLDCVYRDIAETRDAYLREAVDVAMAIVRKLHGTLATDRDDEIRTMLDGALRSAVAPAALTVRIGGPAGDSDLPDRIKSAVRCPDTSPQIMVIADDRLASGDCLIEWRAGGVERRIDDIWREIEMVVDRTFGTADCPGTAGGPWPSGSHIEPRTLPAPDFGTP
jgi:flagellar assembly protein FliH